MDWWTPDHYGPVPSGGCVSFKVDLQPPVLARGLELRAVGETLRVMQLYAFGRATVLPETDSGDQSRRRLLG